MIKMRELTFSKEDNIIKYVIGENDEPCAMGSFDPQAVNPGDIFCGIIREHAPTSAGGAEAYFADIGDARTAYLESGLYKTGSRVLLQVLVAAHDGKGALVTDKIESAGELCHIIFAPGDGGRIKISKKITDEKERETLTAACEGFAKKLNGYGLIITARTDAAGHVAEFIRETRLLISEFESVLEHFGRSREIESLRKNSFWEQLLRTYRNIGFDKITTDDSVLAEDCRGYFANRLATPEITVKGGRFSVFDVVASASRVSRYTGKKILLRTGAWLTCEKTEAMYVFDVNSGSSKKAAAEINREAAEVIMRVLALRNLSGIIMCDFINTDKAEGLGLTEYMKSLVPADYAYVEICGLTRLGVMEIMRRRI